MRIRSVTSLIVLVATFSAATTPPAAALQAQAITEFEPGIWNGRLHFDAGLVDPGVRGTGVFRGSFEMLVGQGIVDGTANLTATASVQVRSGSDTQQVPISGVLSGSASSPITMRLSTGPTTPLHVTQLDCDMASGWWGSDVWNANLGAAGVGVTHASGRWTAVRVPDTGAVDLDRANELLDRVQSTIEDLQESMRLIYGVESLDDVKPPIDLVEDALDKLEPLRNELANLSQCERQRIEANGESVEVFDHLLSDFMFSLIEQTLNAKGLRNADEMRRIIGAATRTGLIGAGSRDPQRAAELSARLLAKIDTTHSLLLDAIAQIDPLQKAADQEEGGGYVNPAFYDEIRDGIELIDVAARLGPGYELGTSPEGTGFTPDEMRTLLTAELPQ